MSTAIIRHAGAATRAALLAIAGALFLTVASPTDGRAQTADTSGPEGRAQVTQGIAVDTGGEGVANGVGVANVPRVDGTRLSPNAPLPGSPVLSNSNQQNEAFWSQLRQGEQGTVSIPAEYSGVLIQSGGESWQRFRQGWLSVGSGLLMIGVLIALSLFFAARGRIRIEEGPSRYELKRFGVLDRASHWLMALSFIILALTGFNLLYGRPLLIPLIGKDAYAAVAGFGKMTHNYVAFAFMLSLVTSLLLWVRNNIPNRTDWAWIKAGGGAFGHAPARKFNAGQKVLFWLVMLMGLSVSLSGWALLWPFQTTMFADTFALVGYGPISAIQEQQLAQAWHTIVSVLFVAMVFAHIYIGTVGMEGAFSAMGRGRVDLNWAREHHGLWVDEMEAKGRYPTLKPADERPARGTTNEPPAGSYAAPAE